MHGALGQPRTHTHEAGPAPGLCRPSWAPARALCCCSMYLGDTCLLPVTHAPGWSSGLTSAPTLGGNRAPGAVVARASGPGSGCGSQRQGRTMDETVNLSKPATPPSENRESTQIGPFCTGLQAAACLVLDPIWSDSPDPAHRKGQEVNPDPALPLTGAALNFL